MIHVIGDVHGDTAALVTQIERCPNNVSVIVLAGDVGFGFVKTSRITDIFKMFPDKTFIVIQGNHDNADEMKGHGDNWIFVTTEMTWTTRFVNGTVIGLVAGALSIDKEYRVPGRSWWANEQGSSAKLDDLIAYAPTSEIEVIISHDAPLSQYQKFYESVTMSLTNLKLDLLLERLRESGRPVVWLHGHLHQGYVSHLGNVTVIGIADNSSVTLF